jgi:hypothetical protein
MRQSIKRVQPNVHVSRSGRRNTWVDLGKLSRVVAGGYKLEGPVFVSSGVDRRALHRGFDELMDRLDETLETEADR